MKSANIYLVFFVVMVGISCQAISSTLMGGFFNPFYLISAELSTITSVAIAHKDSVGTWPNNRSELSSFYKNHQELFSEDSLFQMVSFSEPNFNLLEFRDQSDSLAISFITKQLPDSLQYLPKYKEELHFYKFVGSATLRPDSTTPNNYMVSLILDSVILYNSDMEEFGNIWNQK